MKEKIIFESPDLSKEDAGVFIEEDFPESLDQVELGSTWFNVDNHKSYIVASINKASDLPICLVEVDGITDQKGFATLRQLRESYLYSLEKPTVIDDTKRLTAPKILEQAVSTMAERGKTYDTSGEGAERSMEKIVNMFNALTGHNLTTAQGWKFMCCLKLARSEQGQHKDDNYLDGAAYFALAGEAASEANGV